MSWFVVVGIVLAGLSFSAFFSGAETGIYCLSRLRLHLGHRQRDPRAVRLARILEDEPGALSATLIGTNMMNYITTAAVAYMFADLCGFSGIDTEIYTVALLTPVVFVVGEVVPKSLFQLHADGLMMRGSWILAATTGFFRATGALWCFTRFASFVSRLATGPQPGDYATIAPKRRIAMLLQEGLAGHALGEEQSELIDRVVQLSDLPLHAVMVPRNRVTAIDGKADQRQLSRVARRTTHARLPVYDAHRRHIIGLIRVDDLLQTPDWQTVDQRLEPPLVFSAHDSAATAIARMQEDRRQMAIVADRGGQMLGILTLRDLLEEVVGELTIDAGEAR